MSLRIITNPYNTMLAALSDDRQRVNDDIAQLASGKKVTSLAQDPGAAAALVKSEFEANSVDQFTHSVSTLQGAFAMADSSLNSVANQLSSAISVATQGASGILSPSERAALAQQASSIKQQVLGFANTTYQGSYLFAGTANTTKPFVADSSSSSGISYVGNTDINTVDVASGVALQKNLPGSTIFTASGADVFKALSDLVDGLQSGDTDQIASAQQALTQAASNVNIQRQFYGSTLQQLQTTSYNLAQQQTNLAQQRDTLMGADMAKVAANLSQDQTILQATLVAGGKIPQNSLMDYLK
jgi:flagellar hook-associated protein 3 FlgL